MLQALSRSSLQPSISLWRRRLSLLIHWAPHGADIRMQPTMTWFVSEIACTAGLKKRWFSCTHLLWGCSLNTVYSFGLLPARKTLKSWACPNKGSEALKDQDKRTYQEQVRELELFSLEKSRFREDRSLTTTTSKKVIMWWKSVSSQKHQAIRWEEKVSSCIRGGLSWIVGKVG